MTILRFDSGNYIQVNEDATSFNFFYNRNVTVDRVTLGYGNLVKAVNGFILDTDDGKIIGRYGDYVHLHNEIVEVLTEEEYNKIIKAPVQDEYVKI